jgi:hypothetical protein
LFLLLFVQAVEEREWDLDLKRKVQQYGYRFEHNAQNLRGGYLGPLPDFAQQVTARLVSTGACAMCVCVCDVCVCGQCVQSFAGRLMTTILCWMIQLQD